jgi:hypothetical protein
MPFLLMLPLAIFAVIILLTAGVAVAVEIAERRRARLRSRRFFRPVVIEGGRGSIAATQRGSTPAGGVREPAPIRLVRSGPV